MDQKAVGRANHHGRLRHSSKDATETVASADAAATTGIDELLDRLERGFDLIAIGRALIANPDWALVVRDGAVSKLRPFQRDLLSSLI